MISIIIPTYNREKTIKRSVESVLNQTKRDFELIVVDDGSIDGTCDILETIHDSRLRIEKLEHNSGACAARNRGIELAKGEYISFQDSDDLWRPDKLERQYTKLLESGSDIVFCMMEVHLSNGTTRFVPSAEQAAGFFDYQTLLKDSIVSTQTIFGKRECFQEIRFDEKMPRLQDWDLILRLAQRYTVYFQNEVLVDVYMQADSITANTSKGVVAIKRIMEKHQESINARPVLKANHWGRLGNYLLKDGKNPTKAYAKAFLAKPQLNMFIKLILSSTGIMNSIYRKR